MIHSLNKSIFFTRAAALVNPVNCMGVMGKGLALDVKQRYPEAYLDYMEYCIPNLLRPGDVIISPVMRDKEEHLKYILHAATKNHWKNPSRMEWIEAIASKLNTKIQELKLPSIAIPALGCGNGGLDWKKVRPILVKALEPLDCEIEIYEP